MRVLIFGGDGMLGHRLLKHMASRHVVRVTLHREWEAYGSWPLFTSENSCAGLDVRDEDKTERLVRTFLPEVMINCVGIVKQRSEAKTQRLSIEVNALVPHQLASIARRTGCRLIHLSTDCVFSGHRGRYREDDLADAEDIYGRTKWLGEVSEPGCLTLRSSIIGPELSRKSGLLEWFLSQKGKTILGYRRAIFSGFTTSEMSRLIEKLIVEHPNESGLYHVSSEPISKHDLLRKINAEMELGIDIRPDDEFVCDRSLDSTPFRQRFGYLPPPWGKMVSELARELRKGD